MKRFLHLSGTANASLAEENSNSRARSSTANSSASTYSTATATSAVSSEIAREPTDYKNKKVLEERFKDFMKWTSSDDVTLPLGTIQAHKLNKLQKAVLDNNVTRAKSLIKQSKRDVNKVDTVHGFTALHIAASFNLIECALLLIKAPTVLKLNTSSSLGASPHYRPTSQTKKGLKSLSIMSLKTCNVNCQDRKGRTPLMLAVVCRHIEMVKLLLENNASFNITDSYGVTSLHYALLVNDVAIMQLMLHKRAPTALLDVGGFTLLQHALRLRREEISSALIQRGLFVNEVFSNEGGKTALHLAVKNDLPALVKLLLQSGAKLDIKDSVGKTARDYLSSSSSGMRDMIDAFASGVGSNPSTPVDRRSGTAIQLGTSITNFNNNDCSELDVSNISDLSTAGDDAQSGLISKAPNIKAPLSQESIIPEEECTEDISGESGEEEADQTENDLDSSSIDDLSSVEHTNLDDTDVSHSQDIQLAFGAGVQIAEPTQLKNDSSKKGSRVAVNDETAEGQADNQSPASHPGAEQTFGNDAPEKCSSKRASGQLGAQATAEALGASVDTQNSKSISFAHLFGSGGLVSKSLQDIIFENITGNESDNVNSDTILGEGVEERLASGATSGILSQLSQRNSKRESTNQSLSSRLSLNVNSTGAGSVQGSTKCLANKGQSPEASSHVKDASSCAGLAGDGQAGKTVDVNASETKFANSEGSSDGDRLVKELRAVIEEKVSLISQYQEKLQVAEDQIFSLQSKHAESIVRIYDELNKVQDDYNGKLKLLQEREECVSALNEKIAKLESDLTRASAESEAVQSQLAEALEQKSISLANITDMEELRRHLSDLSRQVEEGKQEILLKNSHIKQIQEQWSAEIECLKNANAESSRLKSENEELIRKLENNSQLARTQEDQLKQLLNQIAELREEMLAVEQRESLQSKDLQTKLDAQKSELNAKIETLQREKNLLLKDQQSQRKATEDEVNEQVESLRLRLQNEKQSVLNYRQSIDVLNKDVANLAQTLQQRDEEIKSMQGECISQKQQFQQLTLEKLKLQHELELTNEKLDSERDLGGKTARQLEQLKLSIQSQAQKSPTEATKNATIAGAEQRFEIRMYYEREIESLSQQLRDEKLLRESKEKEGLAVSDALNDLELNLADLKAMYENEVAFSKQLKSVKSRLLNELAASQEEATRLQQRDHDQSLECLQSQYKIQELESRLERELARLGELQESHTQALQRISANDERLKAHERTEQVLREKISELQKVNDAQDIAAARQKANLEALEALKSDKLATQTQMERISGINVKLETELVKWRRESSALEEKVRELEAKLKGKAKELNKISGKHNDTEIEQGRIKSELQETRTQLEAANSSRQLLEANLHKLKETLKKHEDVELLFSRILERGRPVLQNRLVLKSNLKEIAAAIVSSHNSNLNFGVRINENDVSSRSASPLLGVKKVGQSIAASNGGSVIEQCQFIEEQLGSFWKSLLSGISNVRQEILHDAGKWEGAFGNGESELETSYETLSSSLVIKKLVRAQSQRIQETLNLFNDLESTVQRLVEVGEIRFNKLLTSVKGLHSEERGRAQAAVLKILSLKNAIRGLSSRDEELDTIGEGTAQEIFEQLQNKERQRERSPTSNSLAAPADLSGDAFDWDSAEEAALAIDRHVVLLQQKLGDCQRQLKESQVSKGALSDSLKHIERELVNSQKRGIEIELQLESKRTEYNALHAEYINQKDRLSHAENLLRENAVIIDKGKVAADKREKQIATLEKQIAKVNQELALNKKEMEHVQEKHKSEIANTKLENERIAKELLEFSSKLTEAQKSQENNSGATSTLQALLQANEAKIQSLNLQLTQSAESKTKLDLLLQNYKKKVQTLENYLQKSQLELEMVKSSTLWTAAAPLLTFDRPMSPMGTSVQAAAGVDPSVTVLQTLLGQLQSILAGWNETSASAENADSTSQSASSAVENLKNTVTALSDRLYDTITFIRERFHRLSQERICETQLVQKEVAQRKEFQESYESTKRQFEEASKKWATEREEMLATVSSLKSKDKALVELKRKFEDERADFKREEAKWKDAKEAWSIERGTLVAKREDLEKRMSEVRDNANAVQQHADSMREIGKKAHESFEQELNMKLQEVSQYKEQARKLEERNAALLEEKASLSNQVQELSDRVAETQRFYKESERNLKNHYQQQISEHVERLEVQAKERTVLERNRHENERRLHEEYERQVEAQVREIETLRDIVDTERASKTAFEILAKDRSVEIEAENKRLHAMFERMKSQNSTLQHKISTLQSQLNQYHVRSGGSSQAVNSAASPPITRYLERELEQLKGYVLQAVKPSNAHVVGARDLKGVAKLTYRSQSPAVAIRKETKRFELINTGEESLSKLSRYGDNSAPSSARTLISSPLHSPTAIAFAKQIHYPL